MTTNVNIPLFFCLMRSIRTTIILIANSITTRITGTAEEKEEYNRLMMKKLFVCRLGTLLYDSEQRLIKL